MLLTPSAILWHDQGMPSYYETITLEDFTHVTLTTYNDEGVNFDDGEIGSAVIQYDEIPRLITALRRAYNARPVQSQADGVVASVLLQTAVADAPGDFS